MNPNNPVKSLVSEDSDSEDSSSEYYDEAVGSDLLLVDTALFQQTNDESLCFYYLPPEELSVIQLPPSSICTVITTCSTHLTSLTYRFRSFYPDNCWLQQLYLNAQQNSDQNPSDNFLAMMHNIQISSTDYFQANFDHFDGEHGDNDYEGGKYEHNNHEDNDEAFPYYHDEAVGPNPFFDNNGLIPENGLQRPVDFVTASSENNDICSVLNNQFFEVKRDVHPPYGDLSPSSDNCLVVTTCIQHINKISYKKYPIHPNTCWLQYLFEHNRGSDFGNSKTSNLHFSYLYTNQDIGYTMPHPQMPRHQIPDPPEVSKLEMPQKIQLLGLQLPGFQPPTPEPQIPHPQMVYPESLYPESLNSQNSDSNMSGHQVPDPLTPHREILHLKPQTTKLDLPLELQPSGLQLLQSPRPQPPTPEPQIPHPQMVYPESLCPESLNSQNSDSNMPGHQVPDPLTPHREILDLKPQTTKLDLPLELQPSGLQLLQSPRPQPPTPEPQIPHPQMVYPESLCPESLNSQNSDSNMPGHQVPDPLTPHREILDLKPQTTKLDLPLKLRTSGLQLLQSPRPQSSTPEPQIHDLQRVRRGSRSSENLHSQNSDGFSEERRDKRCFFCHNDNAMYEKHMLFDRDKNVTCPILFRRVCKTCGATGQKAHTEKYCPHNFYF